MKENLSKPSKGLNTDASPLEQPKESYRFALNAIMESQDGDLGFIGNEESNVSYANIPAGHNILGKVYIGNEQTCLFLVSEDELFSEIGILNKDASYSTVVRLDLKFRLTHQIDAIFRLRRGCERTVYFTDGLNKPRFINLDKPEDFTEITDFSLFKTYSEIPSFDDFEIVVGGGNLEPGSYNFAIQYLDKDLNPTEWITTSDTVIIYNDNSDAMPYSEVRGSTAVNTDARNFPVTSKSIRLSLSNFDLDYPYYRVAAIVSKTGNGLVTTVDVSPNLSTQSKIYNYTGKGLTTLTEEEINVFNNVVDTAGSIEQIENRLILSDTKGKPVDYCKLQKYASKIRANLVTEEITLNITQDKNNPKRETVNNEHVGYMPGELYSFGIVYIFSDNTTTPVYHIPGKSTEGTLGGMSIDNTLQNTLYTDNNSCTSGDFWGVDSQGIKLKDKNVRHHRFPTRSELDLPLYTTDENDRGESIEETVDVLYSSTDVETFYLANQDALDPHTIDNNQYGIRYKIVVTIDTDGVITTEESSLFSIDLSDIDLTVDPKEVAISDFLDGLLSTTDGTITEIKLYEALASSTEDLTDSFLSTADDTYFDIQDITAFTSSIDDESYEVHTFTGTGASTVLYTFNITLKPFETDDRIFKSTILGINFDNIELPDPLDIAGPNAVAGAEEEVIGYYIVRTERTDDNKLVLDSGIITPITYSSKYASFGLINPSSGNISKDTFNLINPEFLFNKKEYVPQKLVQEGEYTKTLKYTGFKLQDASPGSTRPDNAKEDDDDGWTLRNKARYGSTTYNKTVSEDYVDESDIKSVFALNSMVATTLDMKQSAGGTAVKRPLYNVATDNRANIFHTSAYKDYDNTKYPYVYLTKGLQDQYSTFRTDAFYKETINPKYFGNETNVNSGDIFHGDSYVSALTYSNSFFYRNQPRKWKTKGAVLNFIIGVGSVIAGVLLATGAIFTGGATGPAAAVLISYGINQIATGFEIQKANKVYGELYDAGLRDSIRDSWMASNDTFEDNPDDDEICWVTDGIHNVFFESAVNMNWRMGTQAATDFLDAPKAFSSSEVWNYLLNKLTVPDNERKGGKAYQNFASAEVYDLNLDYLRRDRQKYYFALPESFDCCSDCQEEFPHRVAYSTQSFQEEQIDNYRVFLPNNYRDIEGETGNITNLFRIQNNLYIQTQEGLWHLPQSFQERITSDIVSFIGTGEFFSVPPRKITDDNNGMSAGTEHKWATLKFPSGVLFLSEKQGTVWLFDGNQLKPISSQGMNSWFKENLRSKLEEQYYATNGVEYPYKNNPSNPIGTGFISTYDSRNERLLLTKKDSILGANITESDDYSLCYNNGETVIFENITQTIETQEALPFSPPAIGPWEYTGLNKTTCELEFERKILEDYLTEKIVGFSSTSDLHIFYDVGSLSDATVGFLNTLITNWVDSYRQEESWTGDLYQYYTGSDIDIIDNIELKGVLVDTMPLDDQERWLYYPTYAATKSTNTDMVVVGFVDETNGNDPLTNSYHGSTAIAGVSNRTTAFNTDKSNFLTLKNSLTSFAGLIYTPLNAYYPGGGLISTYNARLEFMKHIVAAIEGENLTDEIIDNLTPNQNLVNKNQWEGTSTDLIDSLKTATGVNNPYDDNLRKAGWDYNLESYQSTADPSKLLVPGGTEMTTEDFTEDMNAFISNTTEVVEEVVQVEGIETTTIAGVTTTEAPLENSWTMSYSLKFGSWTSFHSYMPNIYIHTPDRFFSWKVGNDIIWKHNVPNSFQTYYGVLSPFIVEYVSSSNPVQTRLWDSIKLHTEARSYNTNLQSHVEERFKTFNKLIAYNSRQTTGELNLEVKDTNADQANYLSQQVTSPVPGTVIIDKNEKVWSLNDLKDIRIDYTQPIFNETLTARQQDYYIDKVLNIASLDLNKDWTQLEPFRDKYLVLRLIFDNFDDVKLILNYSTELEKPSYR